MNSNSNSDYYYDDEDDIDSCEFCKRKPQKITFRDFCKNDVVMLMQIMEKNTEDIETSMSEFESKFQIVNANYMNFKINLEIIHKNSLEDHFYTQKNKFYQIINNNNKNGAAVTSLNIKDKLAFWINNKDLLCGCPKLRLKRKYLIMMKSNNLLKFVSNQENDQDIDEDVNDDDEEADLDANSSVTYDVEENNSKATEKVSINKVELNSTITTFSPLLSSTTATSIAKVRRSRSSANYAGILADRETVIIEWRPEYMRRLRRFVKLHKNGKCS
jgi:hypothetical protein